VECHWAHDLPALTGCHLQLFPLERWHTEHEAWVSCKGPWWKWWWSSLNNPKLSLRHLASTGTRHSHFLHNVSWHQAKHWTPCPLMPTGRQWRAWQRSWDLSPEENRLPETWPLHLSLRDVLTDMDEWKKRTDDATTHYNGSHCEGEWQKALTLWSSATLAATACYSGSNSLKSMLRVPGTSRLCQCHLL
jgi:hypothetical protein